MTLIQDITDRKRAETERNQLLAHIQEQAERLQQIMKAVPEGVLLLDTDGQIILTNPAAERDLGLLADAQVGDTITHLGDHLLEELLTSPPKGLWHEVTVDSPTRRYFETIARPLETGPEPKGWVLVVRDVTQERGIQQKGYHPPQGNLSHCLRVSELLVDATEESVFLLRRQRFFASIP